ncbi:aldo/keto reductase [Sphingorhabdus lutea]|uniref:Aldo/keto reductase n=1 Tax=Sphingorhabdus lutea TaxID=1913578 RepID=A0A1L3J9A9_9SPHN|nr:aldo/keto reductase [Sphingorhabdus lutea]APG61683.1 aldo/keto reductase [Sphingorhabdus lutea]
MNQYLPSPAPHHLGDSKIALSPIAWGMWRFVGDDVDAAEKLVNGALEAGITLFDTADIYGFNGNDGFGDSETLLGKVFARDASLRDRMFLASKGGIMPPIPYDSSADYLAKAMDASLTRMGVEQMDLWQIHRPDILTHPQELARTLENAHKAGKFLNLGVSNMTQAQIEALNHFLTIPIATTQPEFSPLRIDIAENGELDQAMRLGMKIMAWSPLGGGRIADPQNDREKAVVAVLDRVANEQGVSRTSAAYSWIMAHPARIIPIIGSQRVERIAEAMESLNVKWTRNDWYDVLVAARGVALP